jgi:hypothetical protein
LNKGYRKYLYNKNCAEFYFVFFLHNSTIQKILDFTLFFFPRFPSSPLTLRMLEYLLNRLKINIELKSPICHWKRKGKQNPSFLSYIYNFFDKMPCHNRTPVCSYFFHELRPVAAAAAAAVAAVFVKKSP